MKTYSFVPFWRGGLHGAPEPVQLVQQPTREWFAGLVDSQGVLTFRFALLRDGELYFGDGFKVLHRDVQQLRGPSKETPILIGVARRIEGNWYVFNVQFWMASRNEWRPAQPLLARFQEWRDAVEAMGNDPFTDPPGMWKVVREDG